MIFRGYDLDLLPFVGVPSQKCIWEDAISVVKPEVAEKYKNGFMHSAELVRNRLGLLRRKYSFYKRVLRRDDKLIERYGGMMGEEMLDDRVLYAVSECISHGRGLNERLNEFIAGFSDFCRKHESEDYSPSIEAPMSGCEFTGICGCIGSKRPYMSSCVGDLTTLPESNRDYEARMKANIEAIAQENQ
ncbi:hypothetical protein J4443_04460 [Candidatus Woesearchaeota archaeon]|nr:hypothetical protein [Candidatus Woesearchaeota archaeon]